MQKRDNIAIKVTGVSKSFKLPHERHNSLKGKLVNFSKQGYEIQHTLSDISFEVKKGEFFGIVGRNGSGKSTMLKMLAGIYKPDNGSIEINGKLTPFIELGVGFNVELSGRDNVYLNGALLGFGRKEMDEMYNDIVEFAELEKFMDQKLKNYSSGMQVRLAFSVAIRAQSGILLLDEVLAVGDAIFQRKCFEYFKTLKKDKVTVILVSHDISALQEYCDRAILIEQGELIMDAPITEVVNEYLSILNRNQSRGKDDKPGDTNHVGTGRATIKSVSVKSSSVRNKDGPFTEADEYVIVTMKVDPHEDIEDPVYGLTIMNEEGVRIFAANNIWNQTRYPNLTKDKVVTLKWRIPNIFSDGTFTVTPGVATSGATEMLDHYIDAAHFQVAKKRKSNAYTNISYGLEIDD